MPSREPDCNVKFGDVFAEDDQIVNCMICSLPFWMLCIGSFAWYSSHLLLARICFGIAAGVTLRLVAEVIGWHRLFALVLRAAAVLVVLLFLATLIAGFCGLVVR